MFKRTLFSIVIGGSFPIGLTSATAANWEYQFSNATHQALHQGVSFNGFGLVCRPGENPTLQFIGKDRPELGQTPVRSGTYTLKVDDGEPATAEIMFMAADGALMASTAVDWELAEAIRDAKKSVWVSFTTHGKTVEEGEISATGSTRAMKQLLDACRN